MIIICVCFFFRFKYGIKVSIQFNTPKKFTSNNLLVFSEDGIALSLAKLVPAFRKIISGTPLFLMYSVIFLFSKFLLVTSSFKGMILPPLIIISFLFNLIDLRRFKRLAAATTFQPLRRKFRLTSLPIPEDAPVIKIVLFIN